jgi:hypothetical protein
MNFQNRGPRRDQGEVVDEQEQTAVGRIRLKLLMDDSRKAAESFAHLGWRQVGENLGSSSERQHDEFSRDAIVCECASSCRSTASTTVRSLPSSISQPLPNRITVARAEADSTITTG